VRGRSARLAGLAAVGWGLVVWAFGESFGGIFAPGLTVLFGAPGAVLIYVVAGALLALPERAWDNPRRLGRLLLGGAGAFFLGMTLLQAWPGRGFWQGTLDGQPGSLAAMVKSMAGTPQPHAFESVVSWFGNFTEAHGFAVNLFAVLALALVGAGLSVAAVRGDARLARAAVVTGAVFCLADWVLVEDLGFFGGLGTDPNSMIPFILLLTAGYLALAPAPARAPATATATAAGALEVESAGVGAGPGNASHTTEVPGAPAGPSDGLPRASRAPVLLRAFAGAPMQVVAAVGALGVILVGAAPMAFASVNRTADPIIAQAIAGTSGQPDTPAPGFTLTSQDGRQVSLAGLRGKVVLLTFLDPVCTTDCPLIAQEMRSADTMLGAKASNTELVAVVANPTYTSIAYTKAFTSQENLGQVPNWLYLTGSLSQLADVWHSYGIEVEDLPAGAMSAHNDLAFVISADGTVQQEISDDPGPGTPATTSSFAGLMADSVLQSMSKS
jgi:cytochrome oxidase Cu insertion factor (SCO1/SenC/PrrC family)